MYHLTVTYYDGRKLEYTFDTLENLTKWLGYYGVPAAPGFITINYKD